ncbi:related to phospholipase a-2-activating protein [Cephalotrichum gorgonifer]|uniref:Related to phospholipase a-2-activating protein n=1 Tax=Cephalotrichum gorgonifer TaxID=2041049 RepID=A0AAE8SZT3_9PEZI|nr:related to phospholipase a-2-activating protein [Cephalotrichum gorgonifer]
MAQPVFQLSAQLAGHDADVRGVVFAHCDTVFSASRDCTVRRWNRSGRGTFDQHITAQGSDYINSITFLRPTPAYPEGLVISGGRDTVIEARRPGASASDPAEQLLVGHTNNVCTLDVSPSGSHIVSGGWDGKAYVWSVEKWEAEVSLTGHEGTSVWAVLALDDKTVVTASTDKNIRVFDLGKTVAGEAQPLSTIHTPDIVRALCRLPAGHASGADIVSSHNDGVLRLWRLNGQLMAELRGHDIFVYSLAALPTGEIISGAEDRTVRVWRGTECVQVITHPAISVWSVAACPDTGDIVSGASDGVVRVFTRSEERVADAEAIASYDESVKASAIPANKDGGGINKEKLPGPEFIRTKAGTKEGQVQMIREDNESISAYTWSMASQQWVNVGTVVDSAGSTGRKVEYEGKEYDYVFDVDIEDGKPPLKLPYNLSENPYDRARKFLGDNDLPLTYLDNVVQFIEQNTKGATLGETGGPAPSGPGEDDEWQKKVLPQNEYLSILAAKHEAIINKILSVNANMISSGRKDAALNPLDQTNLKELRYTLEGGKPVDEAGLELILRIATAWDYPDRLPGIDLLRCATPSPLVAGYKDAAGRSIVQVAIEAAAGADGASENYVMMALRSIANLFATQKGRDVAVSEMARVLELLERVVGIGGGEGIGRRNRNVLVAATTVALNYAVLSRKKSGLVAGEKRGRLIKVLERVLGEGADAEVCFRGLVALGTLLYGGVSGEGVDAGLVRGVMGRVGEERVKGAAEEVLGLLR